MVVGLSVAGSGTRVTILNSASYFCKGRDNGWTQIDQPWKEFDGGHTMMGNRGEGGGASMHARSSIGGKIAGQGT